MANQRIKVLYIAGWSRSGSTVLSNILGQFERFFSVGEIRYIWDRGFKENWFCGCGLPFSECPVWQGIVQEAFGLDVGLDLDEMIRSREQTTRARYMPLMLIPGGDQLLRQRAKNYLQSLEDLYLAIKTKTNSHVIIDSSKFPMYGYLLGTLPLIDLYVVHLIRDPRATAYSWQRRRVLPLAKNTQEVTYLPQITATENSIRWNVWNVACEILGKASSGKYCALRYEDFMMAPRQTVESICQMVDENAALGTSPFIDNHTVELGITHSISGNPNRLKIGLVKLKFDTEWRSGLKDHDKVLTTTLTWPLMFRHKYHLRSTKKS